MLSKMGTTGLLSHPEIDIAVANDKHYNTNKTYADTFRNLPPLSLKARALKILLLEPLYPPEAVWGSVKVEQGFLPPLGVISIYTFLKNRGFNVQFIDSQFGDFDQDSLGEYLRNHKFDVVGIPTFTSNADYCFETAHLVRKNLPYSKIVFGNIHASSQPKLTFAQCSAVDVIVRHEGEFTLDELLRSFADQPPGLEEIQGIAYRIDGEYRETASRPFIADLDVLPKGFYSDLNLSRYIPHPTQYVTLPNYPVITQRGCPYPCTFCEASVILGKKMRFFSPERVVEELKILVNEKGARGVYFQDSTFTVHKPYVLSLMNLMQKENLKLLWSCNTRTDRIDDELCVAMRETGCRQIFFGIESGNQSSLDLIKKQIRVEIQTESIARVHRHRIATACNYILCLPGEDAEMAVNTIEYAKRLGSRIALFYLPVPYPGSALYQACKESGGIRETDKWADFLSIDFSNPVYINPKIGKDRMIEIYRSAYRRYYSSPRVWMSNLRALCFWGLPLGASLRGANALVSLVGPKKRKSTTPHRYHGQVALSPA